MSLSVVINYHDVIVLFDYIYEGVVEVVSGTRWTTWLVSDVDELPGSGTRHVLDDCRADRLQITKKIRNHILPKNKK